jgi:CBS domain-containing protein
MSLESTRVSDIMKKNVKVEEQNQNIFAVSKIMYDYSIGSVVIVDSYVNKNPIGIVTEKDIIRILSLLQPMQLQVPIREHMSHPVVTLSSSATIADAMTIMYERKIRRVLIVEGVELVGIVTERDIFEALIGNKDLLNSVLAGNLSIHQKPMREEFSRFWFSNSFFK